MIYYHIFIKYLNNILAILTICRSKCNKLTKPTNFHFQPPCQWTCVSLKYKNINRWLENNLHGIPWSSGDVPYKMKMKISNRFHL